ncbi:MULTISPECIES: hypothetical protein [Yersinia]|uniref:hypothetical protein n=1 Tax=Yersinia TaxID=629 RepID=UPI0021BD1F39|nr:hypothetical protein [Yersinia rohdei]
MTRTDKDLANEYPWLKGDIDYYTINITRQEAGDDARQVNHTYTYTYAAPFDKTRELALSVSALSVTSKGAAGCISCGKDLIVTAQRLDNLASDIPPEYLPLILTDTYSVSVKVVVTLG